MHSVCRCWAVKLFFWGGEQWGTSSCPREESIYLTLPTAFLNNSTASTAVGLQ